MGDRPAGQPLGRWTNVGDRCELHDGDRLLGWVQPGHGRWSLYVCRRGLGWGAGEQRSAATEDEAKAVVEEKWS